MTDTPTLVELVMRNQKIENIGPSINNASDLHNCARDDLIEITIYIEEGQYESLTFQGKYGAFDNNGWIDKYLNAHMKAEIKNDITFSMRKL